MWLPSWQFSRFVQIRTFFVPDIVFLKELGEILNEKDFFNTELVLNYDEELDLIDYSNFLADFRFHISRIVIMACPIINNDYLNLVVCKSKLVDEAQCGIINENLFSINIDSYLRSLSGNSCLYKKISVDKNGNIKNCPSFSYSYGKVEETDILSIYSNPEYQTISSIKKDTILVCKDCEFRIICTDCRAYINNPIDILSKPTKCTYNPYNASWQ